METEVKHKRKVDYRKLNAGKRFCNTDVEHEVGEKLGISHLLVRQVAEAQSKFILQTIKGGGMEVITMVYLGKLKVNPYQVQKMMGKQMKR